MLRSNMERGGWDIWVVLIVVVETALFVPLNLSGCRHHHKALRSPCHLADVGARLGPREDVAIIKEVCAIPVHPQVGAEHPALRGEQARRRLCSLNTSSTVSVFPRPGNEQNICIAFLPVTTSVASWRARWSPRQVGSLSMFRQPLDIWMGALPETRHVAGRHE